MIDNPPLKIYVDKIDNRITFKIKTGYYHQFLTPESMKLLGNTKNKVSKDINGKSVSHLEITEVVLVHCNVVNNDYQHDSRVFDAFTPNKSFGQVLDISPINLIILRIILTLVINWCVTCKEFLSFAKNMGKNTD